MNKKEFSSKQEHAIADSLDWKVVSGSGARIFHLGDVTSDLWLGECKTHTSSGNPITFNRGVWDKIRVEAMAVGKYPVLFVDDGSQKLDHTWCLFPEFVISPIYPEELFFVSNAKFHLLPYTVRKNITFRSDDLNNYFKEESSDIGHIFRVTFGTPCYICNLRVFQRMCDIVGW